MEKNPPHFMMPHLTLPYPKEEVRRDMHHLLLHTVRHSNTHTPADKAKMAR